MEVKVNLVLLAACLRTGVMITLSTSFFLRRLTLLFSLWGQREGKHACWNKIGLIQLRTFDMNHNCCNANTKKIKKSAAARSNVGRKQAPHTGSGCVLGFSVESGCVCFLLLRSDSNSVCVCVFVCPEIVWQPVLGGFLPRAVPQSSFRNTASREV